METALYGIRGMPVDVPELPIKFHSSGHPGGGEVFPF